MRDRGFWVQGQIDINSDKVALLRWKGVITGSDNVDNDCRDR